MSACAKAKEGDGPVSVHVSGTVKLGLLILTINIYSKIKWSILFLGKHNISLCHILYGTRRIGPGSFFPSHEPVANTSVEVKLGELCSLVLICLVAHIGNNKTIETKDAYGVGFYRNLDLSSSYSTPTFFQENQIITEFKLRALKEHPDKNIDHNEVAGKRCSFHIMSIGQRTPW